MERNNKNGPEQIHPAEEIPTASRIPGRRSRNGERINITIGGGPFGPQMIIFHSPEGDPYQDDPNP